MYFSNICGPSHFYNNNFIFWFVYTVLISYVSQVMWILFKNLTFVEICFDTVMFQTIKSGIRVGYTWRFHCQKLPLGLCGYVRKEVRPWREYGQNKNKPSTSTNVYCFIYWDEVNFFLETNLITRSTLQLNWVFSTSVVIKIFIETGNSCN